VSQVSPGVRSWVEGRTGFETQARQKADHKQIINGQEVSVNDTVNHYIISKTFLYVHL
jgi:hypothetical protein